MPRRVTLLHVSFPKMTFIEISEIGQNPKVVWFAGPFISDGRYIPECKTNFHFYLWFSSLISVQYAEL